MNRLTKYQGIPVTGPVAFNATGQVVSEEEALAALTKKPKKGVGGALRSVLKIKKKDSSVGLEASVPAASQDEIQQGLRRAIHQDFLEAVKQQYPHMELTVMGLEQKSPVTEPLTGRDIQDLMQVFDVKPSREAYLCGLVRDGGLARIPFHLQQPQATGVMVSEERLADTNAPGVSVVEFGAAACKQLHEFLSNALPQNGMEGIQGDQSIWTMGENVEERVDLARVKTFLTEKAGFKEAEAKLLAEWIPGRLLQINSFRLIDYTLGVAEAKPGEFYFGNASNLQPERRFLQWLPGAAGSHQIRVRYWVESVPKEIQPREPDATDGAATPRKKEKKGTKEGPILILPQTPAMAFGWMELLFSVDAMKGQVHCNGVTCCLSGYGARASVDDAP